MLAFCTGDLHTTGSCAQDAVIAKQELHISGHQKVVKRCAQHPPEVLYAEQEDAGSLGQSISAVSIKLTRSQRTENLTSS